MRVESVEIYSDKTNYAVLRHPNRKFPGILVQGDTLHVMCREADDACTGARELLSEEAYGELNRLRNGLWSLLNHYKAVLGEHEIPLPFRERYPR